MNNSTQATPLFYAQLGISILGLCISSAMIILNPSNSNAYLPIITSLIFSWIPSPGGNQGNDPKAIATLTDDINLIKKHLQIEEDKEESA